MRNVMLIIHRWLALVLGVFMSVLCFTGAALLYQKEIIRAFNSDIYQVTVPEGAQRLGRDELIQRVEDALEPGQMVLNIDIPDDPSASANALIAGMGRQDFLVNPYTGEVYGTPKGAELFGTVKSLHRFLLNEPEDFHSGGLSVGRFIVGVSAFCMALVLLTGVFLWWPNNRRMLRNRLTLSFRKGFRRFVYDSHVSLGIYIFAFLLLMALTGPAWTFGWYGDFLQGLLPDDGNFHMLLMKLHVGRWGGEVSRACYFTAALLGGFLPWSGYYMWYKRTRASKK